MAKNTQKNMKTGEKALKMVKNSKKTSKNRKICEIFAKMTTNC